MSKANGAQAKAYQRTLKRLIADRKATAERLADLETAIRTLQKLLPEDQDVVSATDGREGVRVRRRGSGQTDIELVADFLREVGKPVHIETIVEDLQGRGAWAGRDPKKTRYSVGRSLDRRSDIFTRTAPATYYLRDQPMAQTTLDEDAAIEDL